MKRIYILFLAITFLMVPVAGVHAQQENQFTKGYVEVIDGCKIVLNGCLNIRSGPGIGYSRVHVLRIGAVLYVDKSVTDDTDRVWYRVVPTPGSHPERVTTEWYIAAEFVVPVTVPPEPAKDPSKKIVVDLSDQTLTAYQGDKIFMKVSVSTGRAATPTFPGRFTILWKTPSRYMQGPIPGAADISGKLLTDVYDLPGVPWDMYFTVGGAAFHGTYWHNDFGKKHSHGCVNLTVKDSYKLYGWAAVGTRVIVQP
ncbi:MAG TPA: L,D-transpeptidase family protein [Candidatus Paceibacterota bacterium]|nr:L,D-transpeptidase family protein [Candidatus Paceibacterota bacterium]